MNFFYKLKRATFFVHIVLFNLFCAICKQRLHALCNVMTGFLTLSWNQTNYISWCVEQLYFHVLPLWLYLLRDKKFTFLTVISFSKLPLPKKPFKCCQKSSCCDVFISFKTRISGKQLISKIFHLKYKQH
jgi:hypothetical protein